MNKHYNMRYFKFIEIMKQRQISDQQYTEKHHIVPRCMGGTDDQHNLIKLLPREHYIAHMILALAYPDNFKITSAFVQMAHKNTKKTMGQILSDRVYSSKIYHKLKCQFYEQVKENNKGVVYARDINSNDLVKTTSDEYNNNPNLIFHTEGFVNAISNITNEPIRVTRDEYKNDNSLITHSTGMVYATSLTTQETVRVTTDEYKNNKELTHNCVGMMSAYDINTNQKIRITSEEYKTNEDLYIDQSFYRIKIKDTQTNEILTINKEDWCKYKNIMLEPEAGKLKKNPKYVMVKTFCDKDVEYKKQMNKGKVLVKCKLTNTFMSVPVDQYDPLIHDTTTKGKVLSKDLDGNMVLVSKEEFNKGGYVGQTKGMCKVLDKVTNMIVLVTKYELQNNPDRYEGHMKGKINVVDKITGMRISIAKEDYDKTRYCTIGTTTLLFDCYVKETGKIKKINYFEYLIFPYKYDIIDFIKFDKITAQQK